MILKLNFVNHHGYDDILEIKYPYIDYRKWLEKNVQSQEDIINKLNNLLSSMDCTRDYPSGRPMMTTYNYYDMLLEDYFYYLLKLDNQFMYNQYIQKVIDNHVRNKTFEYNFPYLDKWNKPKEKKTKKPKIENKYLRRETKDLFTGKIIYFYENLKTGDSIKSKDPNLLEELNSKPKKIKKEPKTKSNAVSLSAMTFSFAKKK